jgi:hypothetical protein
MSSNDGHHPQKSSFHGQHRSPLSRYRVFSSKGCIAGRARRVRRIGRENIREEEKKKEKKRNEKIRGKKERTGQARRTKRTG